MVLVKVLLLSLPSIIDFTVVQLFYTELGSVHTRKNGFSAKDILENKNKTIPFDLELIRLDMNVERRPEMEAGSGKTTLPQIFIGNKFIGVSHLFGFGVACDVMLMIVGIGRASGTQ